ncbi:Os05g0242700 [Oryza sativa Japonica Group]|jgi:hypothetical protein|uniref:Os05g0242700 protein n=3 Tax=Oryza sativa TaxID=4530 RepID=B9FJH1_ORYSJ|nr:hypothetical protein OsI_19126 [Oryza sativa Indica Group]EEE62961.1 hypothetical protein OsJ_17768 [Oryza sativa Japonica Group]BAS92982.1 Os05g0242700 [Oryza sativa Japonica Group]
MPLHLPVSALLRLPIHCAAFADHYAPPQSVVGDETLEWTGAAPTQVYPVQEDKGEGRKKKGKAARGVARTSRYSAPSTSAPAESSNSLIEMWTKPSVQVVIDIDGVPV